MRPPGHPGGEATLRELRKSAFWPGMRAHVRTYVRTCLNCKKTEVPHRSERDLGQAPHGTKPHEVWHMDFVDMCQTSREGRRHLLVLKDDYSSLMFLYPTESASAEATVDALRKWSSQWGYPTLLVSDQGSHFIAKTVVDHAVKHGVKRHLSTPNHSQSSGTVEVAHRAVQRTVAALLSQLRLEDNQWDEVIEEVTRGLNQRARRRLGNKSAMEICTGQPPRTALRSATAGAGALGSTKTPSVTEYQSALTDLHQTLDTLHRDVDRRPRGAAGPKTTARSTKRTRGDLLEQGQLVLLSPVTRERRKTRGQASGPYRLLEVDRKRKRVKIQHVAMKNVVENVPFDRLHEYHDPGLVITAGTKKTILSDDRYVYTSSEVVKCVGHMYQHDTGLLVIECKIRPRGGRAKSKQLLLERLQLDQVASLAPKKLARYSRELQKGEMDDDDVTVVTLIESALAASGRPRNK